MSKTHRMSNTRIYKIWKCMKNRCLNPNADRYKYYGGKGISICNEWVSDFMSFYNWSMQNGYEENLSIDRKDVNGNYEPNNCRWITMKKQQSNTSRNRLIDIDGIKKTITEWSGFYNVNTKTIYSRLRRGERGRGLFREADQKYNHNRQN